MTLMEDENEHFFSSSILDDASFLNDQSLSYAIKNKIEFNRICIIKRKVIISKNISCNDWYQISSEYNENKTLIYIIDENIKEDSNLVGINNQNLVTFEKHQKFKKNKILDKVDLLITSMIANILDLEKHFTNRDSQINSDDGLFFINLKLKKYFFSIPQQKIKYAQSQFHYLLRNLPVAKKIKIKRITHSTENMTSNLNNLKRNKFIYSDTILIKKLSPNLIDNLSFEKEANFKLEKKSLVTNYRIKFCSVNEFFYIENNPIDSFKLDNGSIYQKFMFPFIFQKFDLLKGIFKNNYVIYKILDIEYEEYDILQGFLKDERIFKIFKNSQKLPYINSFYIDENTELEFINSLDEIIEIEKNLFINLPKNYLKYIQSLFKKINNLECESSNKKLQYLHIDYYDSCNKYNQNMRNFENDFLQHDQIFQEYLKYKHKIEQNFSEIERESFEIDFYNNLFNEFEQLLKNHFNYDLLYGNLDFVNKPLILSVIGPENCGITDILKKISDSKGFYFIKKDCEKYSSINEVLNYFKKIEFIKINCHKIILFKNSQRIFNLLDGENMLSIKNELIKIFNFQKANKFDRFCFIFQFKKYSDILLDFKDIFQYSISYNFSDSDSREYLLKKIINNFLFNAYYSSKFKKNRLNTIIFKNTIFHTLKKNLEENFEVNFERKKTSENNSLIEEDLNMPLINKEDEYILNFYYNIFTKTDFKELSRLTIGFDFKEIKYFIDFTLDKFHDYLSKQETLKVNIDQNGKYRNFEFETNQFIKENLSNFKKMRMKIEKTISSIPEVKWSDVGGLENAKDDIYDTIQLPLKFPKLFNNNLKRRSGLLLYGPPGSGKTLLAKAIANECFMNFISIKGPELLNMYVGESEKNIREVFERGRANKPCVLFFDEIDALAPARTKNTDQNNVMDRIVAQFMTEMDGILKGNDLIIIASTNRPDLVDPSLLRPGRFDKMIFVGFPKTKEEKKKILIAQTKKFNLDKDINFDELAELCPMDYSGADIYAVCSSAFTIAFKEYLGKIKSSESLMNSNELKDEIFIVNMQNFLDSIKKISPSINRSELDKYEELKKKYS